MPSLGMEGSYELDTETIETKVTRTSLGNYALGRKNEEGKFRVAYVGRSDSDVRARLKSWVGKTNRPLFKFSYATSPKAACEKECENYHDFHPRGNDRHPDRPEDANWRCPRCDSSVEEKGGCDGSQVVCRGSILRHYRGSTEGGVHQIWGGGIGDSDKRQVFR